MKRAIDHDTAFVLSCRYVLSGDVLDKEIEIAQNNTRVETARCVTHHSMASEGLEVHIDPDRQRDG